MAAVVPKAHFASGRYSKRKRTQVNYCLSELDVSDSEDDYEKAQVKRTKATITSRPLPKRKIFPFMDLPAEIRNIIYDHCLAEPCGVNLVAAYKKKRRTTERVSAETMAKFTTGRYWSKRIINNQIRAAGQPPTNLTPALLAVNKQIRYEALDVLYDNELVFADTAALYSFLANIGPENSKNLKKLRLLAWGYGRANKVYNHACFALLSMATNVTSFHIDAGAMGRTPKACVEQLWRDGFAFLEAYGRHHGKADAVVDILHFRPDVFGGRRYDSSVAGYVVFDADAKYTEFQDELRSLLNFQKGRFSYLPPTPQKKTRKTSKAGSDDEM